MLTTIRKFWPQIVWHNTILIIVVNVCGLYGYYLRFLPIHLYSRLFFLFYSHWGGFGVTAGRHRYFAHRSFKGNVCLDIILMLMTTSVFEQDIYRWVRDHRLHHKHTESDADPHNSKRGLFFSHCGWLMIRKHQQVAEKGKTIDLSDLAGNPVVMFERKYNLLLSFFFTLLLPTIVPWYVWNESLQVSVFYCTMYRYALILHSTWSVNSFAHIYGSRHYDTQIAPAENKYVSSVALGEGYHNYHHTFPWDYKAAEFGHDLSNFTTLLIDFLAWIGLVTERKSASLNTIRKRKARTGSLITTTKHSLRGATYFILMLIIFA